MTRSRRDFLKKSTQAAGLCLLGSETLSLSCRRGRPKPRTRVSKPTGSFEPSYLKLERTGELKRREEQLWSVLQKCRLCARQCGVNRIAGQKGRCSSTAKLKVSSFNPHFGEEQPLVGRRGSGTIFFSNCNLLCVFCQNWEINHRGDGRFVTLDHLAEMMLGLQRKGCHNINMVTPTHVVPHIVRALRLAIRRGLRKPVVYNTGGYDHLETIKLLDGIVDIYLPDFKYMDGTLAGRYSAGAKDYPRVAAAAIKEMHRQTGELKMDDTDVALRGLMIRHLVMPHNIASTDRFVRWVAKELTTNTYVNIMGQYHPAHQAFSYPKIARKVTTREVAQALRWARQAGLKRLAG